MKINNIAIIIPPDDSFREINSAIPSPGVAVLSGYIRSHGYDHKIEDLGRRGWTNPEIFESLPMFADRTRVKRYLAGENDAALEASIERMVKNVPQSDGAIYAFSMDIMPRFTKLGSMLCMARLLKRRFNCVTICGGLLYAEGMEELLEYSFIDYAVASLDVFSYSGHFAFKTFLDEIQKKNFSAASVPGLIYRDGDVIRRNESESREPFHQPDFSGFDLDMYRTSIPDEYSKVCESNLLVLPYRFAAGCKCNCAYCYNSRFKESSHLEPDEIVSQLSRLVNETGCHHYLFLNPCFNISRKFTRDVAIALRDSGLNIKWSDCAMFQGLDADLISLLAEAGCRRLFFGFESLTGNIGKYVTKKLDLVKIVELLEECGRNNIWTGLDIITGFPYETRREMTRLASFLRKYSSLIDSVTINKFMLYRHTKFHYQAEKFGIVPGEGGSMLEAAGGIPFSEANGREWNRIREDTEWGALQLQQALDGSLGYWNDAEMLPLLYGLYEKNSNKKEVKKHYREMVKKYPSRLHDESGAVEMNENTNEKCEMGVLGDQRDFARDIKITVKSMKGKGCRGNHYVGQTFYVVDALTPGRLCMNALSSMIPSLSLLMFGGRMPWGEVETLDVACPDGNTQVIFELSVIKPEDGEKERENLLRTNEKRAKKIGAGKFQKGRK